jgi:hypothetical protein
MLVPPMTMLNYPDFDNDLLAVWDCQQNETEIHVVGHVAGPLSFSSQIFKILGW